MTGGGFVGSGIASVSLDIAFARYSLVMPTVVANPTSTTRNGCATPIRIGACDLDAFIILAQEKAEVTLA